MTNPSPNQTLPNRPLPNRPVPNRQVDRGRAFISDHPLRPLRVGGRPAVGIAVRLTSYRSLPLSCLERITLALDGRTVEQHDLRFVLDSRSFRPEELGRYPNVWWFILDHAEVQVSLQAPLAAGEHLVEGTLVTVEPYVSNGRFHFTSTNARRLSLDAADVAK